MKRLHAALGRLEVFVATTALAALTIALLGWVGLKGLSARTTDDFIAGLVFRAGFSAVVLGALTWRFSKSVLRTSVVAVVAAGVAWFWRNAGVDWAGNIVGWLQDGSLLTWFGGLRGLGTRLTLVLAMVGAALATSEGRHVTIDFATKIFPAAWRKKFAVLGSLVSAAVCAFAVWGFFDFIAVDAFKTPATMLPSEKVRSVGSTFADHVHLARLQARLDLRVVFRVVRGERWDQSLTGKEWNAVVGDDEKLSVLKEADENLHRAPLLEVPGETPRGLFARDLGLLIPLGLLWLVLRFVVWVFVRPEGGGAHGAGAAEAPTAAGRERTFLSSIAGALTVFTGLAGGPWAAALAVLGLLGLPLFAVMAGGAELAWWLGGEPLNRLAPRVMDEQFAGSPVLITIPLFTALGYVLAESKAPQRIVEASRALFGWLPGGLALVCLAASAFFTSLTGGSGVTIIAIGGLLYPTLRKEGYPENFSLGLVTTGGSLGLLLPPSLPILVYALVAGLEFTSAFKAGLLPAVLVLVVLGLWSARVGLQAKVPRSKFDRRAAVHALGVLKWELGIPVLILGGLGTSLTTLEESAAVALAWSLFCALFVHKDLERKQLPKLFAQALSLAGAVILILMMANALMNFVIDRQVPAHVLEKLLGLGLTQRWQFLLVLNVFLLVVGMVMDGFSALLVAVPLVLPFAAHFGLHPFHLAMMVLLNLELAFCMPPLGLNLFISSFRFERPVVSLYKSVLPFVALLTLCLGLVMAVPWFSTVLVQGDIDTARAAAEKRGDPPREAWLLECVQEDTLNPKPCSEAEKVKYAPPDAGSDDDLDDALMKEMMGP
ncbi:MAG: TRAP transporter large permease subunit [Myxococcaceae bacterium]